VQTKNCTSYERWSVRIQPLNEALSLKAEHHGEGDEVLVYNGAAVNPARGLGPMIVSGSFSGWWVSLVGPVVGGVLAAVLFDRFIRKGGTPAIKQELKGNLAAR
jgi:hypothetical protein